MAERVEAAGKLRIAQLARQTLDVLPERAAHLLELGLMGDLGERAPIARHLLPQRGQRGLPVRIDKQCAHVVEELVADRPAHRPVTQPLAGIEDLLDPDPVDAAVAEPREVAGGVGEAVGMVDAEAVDETVADQRDH